MRRSFLAVAAACFLVSPGSMLALSSAPSAGSGAPSSAPAISVSTSRVLGLRELRRIQRLSRRRFSAQSIRAEPSSKPQIGRFIARPSIRDLKEQAERNAVIERLLYPRPASERAAGSSSSSSSSSSFAAIRRPPRATIDPDGVKKRLLELVNEVRRQHDVGPLSYNALLELAAQDYATDMNARAFFSHESPEGSTFDQRIQDAGYPGPCPQPGCRMKLFLGENLAKGFSTPEDVLIGWMNSPGHRANVLSPNFDEVGFGISGTYWSQSFGKAVFST